MKIFITGGHGLAGQNIAEALRPAGHELLTPTHAELDLLDRDAVFSYLSEQQPDLVIHAAGVVGGIAANIQAPVKFLLTNMDMGRNVIYESYRAGIRKLINLGSSCMYPRNSEKPLTEEMVLTGELEPTNEGYALAKCMCTRLCQYLGKEDPSCQYKTLIPCNLYGKGDKFRTERAHMIPAVIHKLYTAKQKGKMEVAIWGSGKARREFLYAGDLGDCVRYCVEHFDAMPDLMNVGFGHDYTVDEYYEAIANVVGYEGTFTHDLSKPEGMKRKLTDITRLKTFGWQAKTRLEDGIRKTFESYLTSEK